MARNLHSRNGVYYFMHPTVLRTGLTRRRCSPLDPLPLRAQNSMPAFVLHLRVKSPGVSVRHICSPKVMDSRTVISKSIFGKRRFLLEVDNSQLVASPRWTVAVLAALSALGFHEYVFDRPRAEASSRSAQQSDKGGFIVGSTHGSASQSGTDSHRKGGGSGKSSSKSTSSSSASTSSSSSSTSSSSSSTSSSSSSTSSSSSSPSSTSKPFSILSLRNMSLAELLGQMSIAFETESVLLNWSENHKCTPTFMLLPSSEEEVQTLLRWATEHKATMRPLGAGVSPNGLAFVDRRPGAEVGDLERGRENCLLSVAHMDEIVSVDPKTNKVRVAAGATVSALLDALRRHNLTLQNLASITDQQLAGWFQTGCHGTGASLPPVDEQVVQFTILSPALGRLPLSLSFMPELFYLAKVGLGSFGVVSEVVLQCQPREKLREWMSVVSKKEVEEMYAAWLKHNRHLRLIWVPHTDRVLVLGINPSQGELASQPAESNPSQQPDKSLEASAQTKSQASGTLHSKQPKLSLRMLRKQRKQSKDSPQAKREATTASNELQGRSGTPVSVNHIIEELLGKMRNVADPVLDDARDRELRDKAAKTPLLHLIHSAYESAGKDWDSEANLHRSLTDLRREALLLDPLCGTWVAQVNAAEATYYSIMALAVREHQQEPGGRVIIDELIVEGPLVARMEGESRHERSENAYGKAKSSKLSAAGDVAASAVAAGVGTIAAATVASAAVTTLAAEKSSSSEKRESFENRTRSPPCTSPVTSTASSTSLATKLGDTSERVAWRDCKDSDEKLSDENVTVHVEESETQPPSTKRQEVIRERQSLQSQSSFGSEQSPADKREKTVPAATENELFSKRASGRDNPSLQKEGVERGPISREGWSEEILGMDCGGQQMTAEVAIPCGTVAHPNGQDLRFVEELQAIIASRNLPAPVPIEHRWSSASSATMSPAFSESAEQLFAWIGVVVYLPEEEGNAEEEASAGVTGTIKGGGELVDNKSSRSNAEKTDQNDRGAKGKDGPEDRSRVTAQPQSIEMTLDELHAPVGPSKSSSKNLSAGRQEVQRFFEEYHKILQDLTEKYGGREHWAKIEIPADSAERDQLRNRIYKAYDVHKFNKIRKELDPAGVLENDFIRALFGSVKTEEE